MLILLVLLLCCLYQSFIVIITWYMLNGYHNVIFGQFVELPIVSSQTNQSATLQARMSGHFSVCLKRTEMKKKLQSDFK